MFASQNYLIEIKKIDKYSLEPFYLPSGNLIHDKGAFFGRAVVGHQEYVIKLANPIDSANIQSIIKESDFLKRFRCKNIVGFIDSGIYEMEFLTEERKLIPYLIIEKCETDLFEYTNNFSSQLILPQVIKIVEDIFKAVEKVQEASIAHLDIRADNILINFTSRQIEAKLADFGTAILINKSEETRRNTSLMVLNEYTPPDDVITPAFDIYSLGVLLTKLVTSECFFAVAYGSKSLDDLTFRADLNPSAKQLLIKLIRNMTHIDLRRRITLPECLREFCNFKNAV